MRTKLLLATTILLASGAAQAAGIAPVVISENTPACPMPGHLAVIAMDANQGKFQNNEEFAAEVLSYNCQFLLSGTKAELDKIKDGAACVRPNEGPADDADTAADPCLWVPALDINTK